MGVVANVDDANIIPQRNLTIYQPFAQGPIFGACLVVRAKNDPYALVPTITKTIRAAAATQPVEHASTLEDVRTEVLANNRVNAIVFGGFAALALAISVVGVAGVLAFSVSWRTREFGIRLALGAQPRRILAGVLIDGATIAAIGIAAGGLVGWGLSRLAGNYVAGTPASRADSVDRIGSSHPHVGSPGVGGAGGEGCSRRHRSSASRGVRWAPGRDSRPPQAAHPAT